MTLDLDLIRQATAWYFNPEPNTTNAPDFMRFVSSSGASRVVWRIKDYVVKFEKRESSNANEDEYTNYLILKNKVLPEGFALPETDLIYIDDYPVIVMEYIDGDESDEPTAMELINLGLYDSEYENVIVRHGIQYLIDLDVLHRDLDKPALV